MKRARRIFVSLLFVVTTANGTAQKEKISAKDAAEFLTWALPQKPYRIIGNLYYVGANELTSFLITTPKGHILLDAGMEEMVPQVEQNIESLGFHLAEVKILLNSQAHVDHAAGLAALKRDSGAKLMVSRGDAPVIESGGEKDFLWPERFRWEPAKVDQLLGDGDQVTLGGVTLTAHLTPGHTRGCTTWTMTVKEGGKKYNVVFVGSTKRIGAKLTGNKTYPQIAEDFTKTFRVLKSLPCDIVLGAHASFYGGQDKAERLARGEAPNPFIDPQGYRELIDTEEKKFQEELRKERETDQSNTRKN